MSIMKDVLNQLMEREGTNLTVDHLARKTGHSTTQVANAAHHLVKRGEMGITRVMNGVYRYSASNGKSKAEVEAPATPATEQLTLNIVAKLPGWSIGVDLETGKAFRVEPLK